MAQKVQLRNGAASEWVSANPILAEGEFGIETDTKKCKLGDGITPWNLLDYFSIGGISSGVDISYDNTTSGLMSVDVQNAIDEVNAKVDSLSGTEPTSIEKIVKQGGTIGVDCDYTDIQSALTAITDNSFFKRYTLRVLDGVYDYSDNGNNIGVSLKNYVTILGRSKANVIIVKRDSTFAWEKATVDIDTTQNIDYMSIQNCTIISNNCKCPLHIDNSKFIGTFEGINLDLINEQAISTGDYQNNFAVGWRNKEHFILKNVRGNGKLWGHNYNNTSSEGMFELINCTSKYIQIGDLTSYGRDHVIINGCKAEYFEHLWFSEY